jgi:hypothetical protein
MKRQICNHLQKQAQAVGLAQVEKDEEMKRQVRQNLKQPPALLLQQRIRHGRKPKEMKC